jgi:sporulation protein YlmC with PRC-barrel domain
MRKTSIALIMALAAAPAAAQQNTTQQSKPNNPSAGIQSVQPQAAVKLSFYAVQPADMRASKLIGSSVYNLNNESIGEIEDIMIDNGKAVRAVVIGVGGFLGVGERNVAVDPGSLTVTEQSDGTIKIVANTNKEELVKAPEVKDRDLDRAAAGSGSGTTGSGQPNQKNQQKQ